MTRLQEALNVLSEDGIVPLVSKTSSHLSYRIRSSLKGGISSRPRVRKVAGIFNPIYNQVFKIRRGKGVDVMSKDWDNLIILDACRYDDFKKLSAIDKDVGSQLSRGSDSKEFILKNICGEELHDTVYVSANPHLSRIGSDVFHKVIDDPLEEWDRDLGCVKPETVTACALKAHKSFPNKKLIIHYMQPHDPPIGQKANGLKQRGFTLGGPANVDKDQDGIRIMEAVASGDLSVDEAREAYRENLKIAMDEVQTLISKLDGKSVITADHGEMFGEKPYPILGRLYEHYRHPHTEELCRVPWYIPDFDSRRKTQADPPMKSEGVTQENIQEQLESLGYK